MEQFLTKVSGDNRGKIDGLDIGEGSSSDCSCGEVKWFQIDAKTTFAKKAYNDLK